MNKLIEFFAKQTLFGNLISITVVLGGLYAMSQVRRETFPNVKFDLISINTAFPGAAPDEVERLITNVIEQEIKEIDGIKSTFSSSYESLSSITVQLNPDQTTDAKAKNDIQDVIDRLTSLPATAKKPSVTIIETKQQPIIELDIGGLKGKDSDLKLRETAKFLEKEIETLKDVARVSYKGLRKLEYRIEADLAKLNRYRVSLDALSEALKLQNVSVPGGTIDPKDSLNGETLIVRILGDFKTQEDIENTVIRGNDLGSTIKVKDVARVTFGLEKRTDYNAVNQKEAIRLTILQKEKADTIRLVETLKAKVESLRERLPEGLELTYLNDTSEFIVRRLNVLTGNLMVGLVLVLVLLSLVLPTRVAILVSLGIPFAFLGTMIVFFNSDITLNLVSLIGLIIVSGMLVDDAIVITDNCVRLMEEGHDPETAAVKGTQEIWPAVMASVLTTIVAFIPLMTMSGIFGKFVKPISYGVIYALIISLVEALFVLPGHIKDYIRIEKKGDKKAVSISKNWIVRFQESSQAAWDRVVIPKYTKLLSRLLRVRYRVALVVLIGFIGVLALAAKGMKVVLFPPDGVEIFTIQTETPTGTPLEKHLKLLVPIETKVQALPKNELDQMSTLIGENRLDAIEPGYRKGTEYGIITVYLTPEAKRTRSADQIIEALRKEVGEIPGIKEITFGRVSGGPPVGKPVSLAVSGANYQDLLPAISKLKKDLSEIPGVRDIKDTYTLGKREIQVRLKPEEAAAAGLSAFGIGNSVRTAYEGNVATSIRTLDEEIDLRVQLQEDQRADPSQMGQLRVPNLQGSLIPLERIANLTRSQGISVYDHKNNDRVILVTADLDTQVTSSVEVNGKLKDQFDEFQKKFPKVKISFGGEDEDTVEALGTLARAFIVALVAIFLILVMTFKSVLQPLLVLVTIPLGISSVILSFFVHGWPITFLGMMGIIALGGVIVNNAIVLVDFVNSLRAKGLDRFQSIEQAASLRFRPVFLTTITTVVGVLPTAYGIGGEDKFVIPIALALGWGLLFGSTLTVLAFPNAIAILDDFQEWSARLRSRLSSRIIKDQT